MNDEEAYEIKCVLKKRDKKLNNSEAMSAVPKFATNSPSLINFYVKRLNNQKSNKVRCYKQKIKSERLSLLPLTKFTTMHIYDKLEHFFPFLAPICFQFFPTRRTPTANRQLLYRLNLQYKRVLQHPCALAIQLVCTIQAC